MAVIQIMRHVPSAIKGHKIRSRGDYTQIVLAAGGWFCLTGFVVSTFAPSLDRFFTMDLNSQVVPAVAGGVAATAAGLFAAFSQSSD